MRYLLLLACLLLVACGGETAPTPSQLVAETAAPAESATATATQTPIIIVVTATPPNGSATAARKTTTAVARATRQVYIDATQTVLLARAIATATARRFTSTPVPSRTPSPTKTITPTPSVTPTFDPSHPPTRKPTRTITLTRTPRPTEIPTVYRTATPTQTPCGNLNARQWEAQVEKLASDIEHTWQYDLMQAPTNTTDKRLQQLFSRFRDWIAQGRALNAPPEYDYAEDDWHAALDFANQMLQTDSYKERNTLYGEFSQSIGQLFTDYRRQLIMECGTPTPQPR